MRSPLLTLSIVSHNQGCLVANLLEDLRAIDLVNAEIILTINVPESLEFMARFGELPIRLIENSEPMGFGANHNQAFHRSRGDHFCVVNPDIRLPNASFVQLTRAFDDARVACCAPQVTGPEGEVQDSVRRFPTLARIVRRVLLGHRIADYGPDATVAVDWAAGMFAMFRREAFAQVGGFDERYFMYLEDADVCRRLCRAGWKILYQPSAIVIHDARRASHSSLRHLGWHLRSMTRFLIGM